MQVCAGSTLVNKSVFTSCKAIHKLLCSFLFVYLFIYCIYLFVRKTESKLQEALSDVMELLLVSSVLWYTQKFITSARHKITGSPVVGTTKEQMVDRWRTKCPHSDHRGFGY